jgi:hypothetical protein
LLFSQSGDHPEINLAKFCYTLDLKVSPKKKKKIPLYSWLPSAIYHRLWPFGMFLIQNLMNLGPFFPMENLLYRSKPFFSGENLAKSSM